MAATNSFQSLVFTELFLSVSHPRRSAGPFFSPTTYTGKEGSFCIFSRIAFASFCSAPVNRCLYDSEKMTATAEALLRLGSHSSSNHPLFAP